MFLRKRTHFPRDGSYASHIDDELSRASTDPERLPDKVKINIEGGGIQENNKWG